MDSSGAADTQALISAMGVLLEGGASTFVIDGARISGGRGDAFVRVDEDEYQRRQASGQPALTQLWMLDVLMNLPLHLPVRTSDLSSDEQWVLDRVPAGALCRDGHWVTRLCRPVADISAVVFWGQRLQLLLKKAAPFTRVAAQMVVLDAEPPNFADIAWQASFQGTGVWCNSSTGGTELVAAQPVRHTYYTAARWHVNEHAYRAWMATTRAPGPSNPACPA